MSEEVDKTMLQKAKKRAEDRAVDEWLDKPTNEIPGITNQDLIDWGVEPMKDEKPMGHEPEMSLEEIAEHLGMDVVRDSKGKKTLQVRKVEEKLRHFMG